MAKGRKIDYTTDKLKKLVNDYVRDNLHKRITITDLVKFTGISKNTWYRYQEAIDYINDMNQNPDIVTTLSDSEYPTPAELYERCKGEEHKTKAIFTQLLDIIESLSANSTTSRTNSVSVDTSKEVEELKRQLQEKDRIIAKQNDKINYLTFKDDSLINIGHNIEKMKVKTFSEQFGYLFDD